MYRVPQAGPRQPAVGGPVVQRGVRRHAGSAEDVLVLELRERIFKLIKVLPGLNTKFEYPFQPNKVSGA